MRKLSLKTVIYLFTALLFAVISCTSEGENASESETSEDFTDQITDPPLTYTNPLNLVVGNERARRMGEPVVLLFRDEYYLFVTGSRGYWVSDNFRDWDYVDAPNFPGGVLTVVNIDDVLYAASMNSYDVYSSADPKSGEWEQAGTFDSDRYGDANMYYDDDGRLYMYYGWSQLMSFKVVELDPKTFKEIGESKVLFFGNPEEHGFERRRADDVIFEFFDHREYFPEEYPWIEGPWVLKHEGKYYLQYAAIGLEFRSYSHGVYVADNPMGPFEYSPHNPLAFKTTGFAQGAGHGSTFRDKNGQLWTICMIPSYYGGRGGAEMALFPTAIDEDGVMHSNTAFGDYPQYYPGVKEDAVNNNFTGWMLLSQKKQVEVSSTLDGFRPGNAVDEDFMTHWSAETGDPGEYMTVDLGKEANIYALQVNFTQQDAERPDDGFRGFGGGGEGLDQYQSYTIEISNDNENWSMLLDKSNVTQDMRHDYTELAEPVKARYVKLTNVFTHDEGKFAVTDFRIFGNPDEATFTNVEDVKTVRDPHDQRNATLLWDPVEGADGYVVRYGIEPDKLYNNYMLYDENTITIHSLNKSEEYYFEVEAFDSGLDYYHEGTMATLGTGAEIELSEGDGGYRGGENTVRKMTYEGKNEYVFDNITPGRYTFRHTFGPVLWRGELTEADLIGSGDEPTVTAELTELGKGTDVLGIMNLKVIPGEETGKIVVTFDYNN